MSHLKQLIIILNLVCNSYLVSQNSNPTINKKLNDLNSLNSYIDSICNTSNQIFNTNHQLAIRNLKQALQITLKNGLIKKQHECRRILANFQLMDGRYAEAYILLNENHKNAILIKDTLLLIHSHINLANLYGRIGSINDAINHYKKGLFLSQKLNYADGIFYSNNFIGNRYADLGKSNQDTNSLKRSIQYYSKNYNQYKKENNANFYSITCNSLADAYTALGTITKNINYYDSSLTYAKKVLSAKNESGINIALMNIAEVYRLKEDFSKALQFYTQACKENKDSIQNIYIYREIATTLRRLSRYAEAIEFMNKSSSLCNLLGQKLELGRNYKLISEIYELIGNEKLSLLNFKKYDSLNKTLLAESSIKQIAKMEVEDEINFQKKQVDLLKQTTKLQAKTLSVEKRQNIALLLFIISLTIATGILLYLYRKKNDLNDELDKAKNLALENLKLQEQFLANTSHEIRTPLNSIIGYANLLDKTTLTKTQTNYLSNIKKSSDSLIKLINELLDFSKIKSNTIELEMVPFNINEIIDTCIDSERIKAEQKNLYITSEPDYSVNPLVIGDPLRLKQILLNLINNAIKFTNSGGLTISTHYSFDNEKKLKAVFTVIDTGIGIENDKLDFIFQNFTQISSSPSRKQSGTGLGLAICKQLVELQGGTISVESSPGIGSQFSFSITYNTQHSINNTESSPINSQPLNGLQILVVDDVELNRVLLKNTLEYYGASVDCVDSAKACLDIIKSKHYDSILTDIAMPEMDGFELSRIVRSKLSGADARTPIIAITADGEMAAKSKALASGMNDFILKPFNDKELTNKIIKHLSHYDKERLITKVANLSYLKEKYRNNTNFLVGIIEVFIKDMPVYLSELNEYLKNKERQKIAKHAHKIKTPILMMGAEQLSSAYNHIQKLAETESDFSILNELVKQNEAQCRILIEELETELDKIKS